jgi:hypothetical protein
VQDKNNNKSIKITNTNGARDGNSHCRNGKVVILTDLLFLSCLCTGANDIANWQTHRLDDLYVLCLPAGIRPEILVFSLLFLWEVVSSLQMPQSFEPKVATTNPFQLPHCPTSSLKCLTL